MTPTTTITLSDFECLHIDRLDGLPWYAAISAAARDGWTLCSYSDPAAEGREGLTINEAIEIAGEAPDLIYLSRTRFSRGTR
jgi:hypothetical protein